MSGCIRTCMAKFRKRKKAEKIMAAIGVGVALKTELEKGLNRQNRKMVGKKVSQHRQTERHTEWEITKAYEFICVVSVKPMCYSPKFSKPHIYQGSIVGRSFSLDCSSVTIIRNPFAHAFAHIANHNLTTPCRIPYSEPFMQFYRANHVRVTKTTTNGKQEWNRLEMATLERNITDPQSGKLRCCRYRFVQFYAPS